MNKEARAAAEELLRDYRMQLSHARKNPRWSAERRAAMQAANQMQRSAPDGQEIQEMTPMLMMYTVAASESTSYRILMSPA